MAGGFLYLDSSALVKLILPEPESLALVQLLTDWEERVSSALAVVEITRAAERASTHEVIRRRTRQVLDGLHLVTIDDVVLESAAELRPSNLRSLDAIHLASALVLQPDLGALVAYDARLAEAARHLGITVFAPGAST